MPELESYSNTFELIELISCVFFTTEFLLRLLSSPNLFTFIRSGWNLIDLAALLPFYFYFIILNFPIGYLNVKDAHEIASFFRVLRFIRIFRILRKSEGAGSFIYSLRNSNLLFYACYISICVIFFSTLAYHSERSSNVNEGFDSILGSMW